jgi:serine/threonine-protein kinase
VAAALAKALEKLPADRFGAAREFADALLNPSFSSGAAHVRAATRGGVPVLGRTESWRAVSGILATACVGLAAWALSRGLEPGNDAPVLRAEVDILTRSDSGIGIGGLDISPDGSMIVSTARPAGSRTDLLYLRRLDDRTAGPIPGTEGADWPAFPDGVDRLRA